MSKKQELIKQCKYYKGEEDNLFEKLSPRDEVERPRPARMAQFWYYECYWVAFELDEKEHSYLEENANYYKRCMRQSTYFDDSTPINLKGILLNRYEH